MKSIFLTLGFLSAFIALHAQVKPEYVLQDKMWSAIKNNNPTEIKALLKQGVDINKKTYQDNYLLLEAVKFAKAETVKLLVENGADINVKNQYGQTALNFSINNKSIERLNNSQYSSREVINEAEIIKIVKILLDAGALIDQADNSGKTLFFDAVQEKQLKLAKFLLNNGADVNYKLPKSGTTALIWVSGKPNKAAIEFLLDNGAEINATDNNGSSALFEAVASNELENVEILMLKGADPFIKSGKNNALKNAINNEYWDIVKAILEKVEDINFTLEGRGYGLVHDAVINENTELLKIMINLGADLNQKNQYGSTPLSLAKYNGNQNIISLLEDAGAK